ncbi:MAG: CTP synthase [Thermoguttaceae bacterium]|nr:CTP synthase [Thermoguttaceae bacterium]
MTKHIFVTGGVCSSLGKGLTSASIGALLESRGLSVRMQKLDPYLNVYPGLLSPFQHGEVYILDDGSETDLDLGHYERFTHGPLTKDSAWSAGKVYREVLAKEKRGDFNGGTVQVIPSVTNVIKDVIRSLEGPDVDVVVTEIGGTVGDLEGVAFLEAIRQFGSEIGRENCAYVHLTLVPYLKAAGELKTKPTQHSVEKLRQIGVQPDFILCRCEETVPKEERDKIGMFCNVPAKCVIEEPDADLSIYQVPTILADQGLDQLLVDRLGLDGAKQLNLTGWREVVSRLRNPKGIVNIAVVGEFAEHHDAYKSVYESLRHAGVDEKNNVRVNIVRICSSDLKREDVRVSLKGVDGILTPGSFGEHDSEYVIEAVKIAREEKIPFFGIDLGMQCAIIEYARNVLNMKNANSTEFDPNTPEPVFHMMEVDEETRNATVGGAFFCGATDVALTCGSLANSAYGAINISERNRLQYVFNAKYRDMFNNSGLLLTGSSANDTQIEVVELDLDTVDHPWFLAVQFHPEYKSKPTSPHPLFRAFVAAAIRNKKSVGSASK